MRMRKKILAILCGVLLIGLYVTEIVHAQYDSLSVSSEEQVLNEEIAAARALVDSMIRTQHIPGMQVAVSVDGETVWTQGFGYADLEHKTPVWPYTKLRIGSVSKTLTSAALGKLMESGKLDLDKPVQEYVPYFPEKKYTVTSRQVAGHIAGIRHYRGNEFLSDAFYPTVKEGLRIFSEDTLLFKPGTDYSYSSYGWNLLSAVVEGASGMKFLKYMREKVFDPLNMDHTVAEYMNEIIHHRTEYYIKNEEDKILNAPYVDNSYKWAGGGFVGTAEDLLRFGNAMRADTFLERSTVRELWKSQEISSGEKTNYGIGWASGTYGEDKRWYGHSGGSVGGTTKFVIFPDQQVVVAMIANLSGVNYEDVHLQIAELFMK